MKVDDPLHKPVYDCPTLSRVVHCKLGQILEVWRKDIVTLKDGVEVSRKFDTFLHCCRNP